MWRAIRQLHLDISALIFLPIPDIIGYERPCRSCLGSLFKYDDPERNQCATVKEQDQEKGNWFTPNVQCVWHVTCLIKQVEEAGAVGPFSDRAFTGMSLLWCLCHCWSCDRHSVCSSMASSNIWSEIVLTQANCTSWLYNVSILKVI